MKPTLNVWDSMGLDRYLGTKALEGKKAVSKLMEEEGSKLIPFINNCEMPFWLIHKLQALHINGGYIKDHGGAGFTHLEAGAVTFEIAKYDASIATFY